MRACGFDEENGVADTPAGIAPEEVEPLSVFRGQMGDCRPVTISCWKVTAEEMAEIQRTGRVWLLVLGHGIPPVAVTGTKPFEE